MRSLAIDVGNTRTKVALFDDGELKSCTLCGDGHLPEADCAIVSLTGERPQWLPPACLELNANMKLPIKLDYTTPSTLGPDRIAAASAAWCRYRRPVMVVDAGTCITVDFVDAGGVYRGGAIMPGLDMKFRALHNFTARLPLLDIGDAVSDAKPVGDSTYSSIVSGVVCATRFALEGYEKTLSEKAGVKVAVVMTGGNAPILVGKWHLQPHLVMHGMNEILMMNLI